jgi:hypothetical protein
MCATEASAAAVDAPGDGCGLGGQMAADAYEERFQPYDDILRSLTAMLVAQRTMNEEQRAMNQRVEGFMQRQDTINERLTAAIERLDTRPRPASRHYWRAFCAATTMAGTPESRKGVAWPS